jgi:RNA polymerase sigma factor (sigma-70 family)
MQSKKREAAMLTGETREFVDSVTIDCTELRVGLANEERDAWRRVDDRYGPIAYRMAIRQHLPADWAEDVRQEVIAALVDAIRKRRTIEKGGLRRYLCGIAHNKVCDAIKRYIDRIHSLPPVTESGELPVPPSPDKFEEYFEEEWRDAVTAECLRLVKLRFSSRDYEIFVERKIEEWPSKKVAQQHGIGVSAVDCVIFNIMQFLKDVQPAIERRFGR